MLMEVVQEVLAVVVLAVVLLDQEILVAAEADLILVEVVQVVQVLS